jgi:hypothetical protein
LRFVDIRVLRLTPDSEDSPSRQRRALFRGARCLPPSFPRFLYLLPYSLTLLAPSCHWILRISLAHRLLYRLHYIAFLTPRSVPPSSRSCRIAEHAPMPSILPRCPCRLRGPHPANALSGNSAGQSPAALHTLGALGHNPPGARAFPLFPSSYLHSLLPPFPPLVSSPLHTLSCALGTTSRPLLHLSLTPYSLPPSLSPLAAACAHAPPSFPSCPA